MDTQTLLCHSMEDAPKKPKNCVSLDETTVDPNEFGTPHQLPEATLRAVAVAHRLFFLGFSNPSDRRIITVQGTTPATDTLVTEMMAAIALTTSVDSRRIYCVETASFGVSSCAARRVKQLAAVKSNVVVMVLVVAALDTKKAAVNDMRVTIKLLEEDKNVALIMTGAGAEETAAGLPELAVVLSFTDS